jgi:hypothetical protein
VVTVCRTISPVVTEENGAHADRVMYEAKRAGGGCWRLFEDTEQAADPALA